MRVHRTDGVSLAFAVVFGIFVAWWAAGRMIDLPTIGWFVAGGLILFGLLGVMGAVRTGWTQRGPAPESTGAGTGSPPAPPPDQVDCDTDSTDLLPPAQDRP